MLPDAVPLTLEGSRAWLSAGLPRWLTRWLPAALWVLAFVVSLATDDTACTPADPSVCGPDHAFAFFVVAALATPLLFLLGVPLLACACGVVFAAADQRYDLVAVSRGAYALHGGLCLVVALLVVRSRRRQQRLLPSAPVSVRGADPGWSRARVTVALLMVPVAAAAFLQYARVSSAEQRHLSRSTVVAARVVGRSSEGSTITLDVAQGIDDSRRLVVEVLDTGPYPVGSSTPLRLDPQDPSWRRLVAEPYDPTGWQALGNGAVALLALAALSEARRRRAVRRLTSSVQPGVLVRAAVLPYEATLFPVETDSAPFGKVMVATHPAAEPDGPEPDSRAFGDDWRAPAGPDGGEPSTGPVAEQAVLVGDLREGGWVVLVTEHEVLVPQRPLRLVDPRRRALPAVVARLLGRAPRAAEPEEEGALPGVPVEAASEAPSLDVPSAVRPVRRQRQLGALFCLGAFVAAPSAVLWLADGWYQRGVAVLLGGQLLLAGLNRRAQVLRLLHDRLEVVGPWRSTSVPWDRLHGARQDGAVLLLAWEPDVVLAAGPLELEGSQEPPDAVASSVGATAVRLRERALALGRPGRPVQRAAGAGRDVLVVYGLLCAAALWLAR